MQYFISESPWQEEALLGQLRRDVCTWLGDPLEGALLLDESGIPKQGKMSAGVQRQYCGRLGKVENCQVGVYLAYSNPTHSTLVDRRLYLPESWIEDAERRKKCGMPSEITFKTKAELGRERLVEGEASPIEVRAFAKTLSPSAWTRLRVRETERGELIAEFAAVRVWHSVDNLPFQEVWLVMRRELETSKIRFSFSNAPPDTPLERLAQMQSRRYWVERALEDAKGEAKLDQYEVRGWRGWHHHMTMTLLAMLFLFELTLQMKKKTPMLTSQDAREILEEFLPRKTYAPEEFMALLEQKHKARLSARKSHAKKQKRWLQPTLSRYFCKKPISFVLKNNNLQEVFARQ